MSIKLYLVRTHKIGITNILTALITKTLADTVYLPCQFTLDQKFINITEGEFTLNFPRTQIRHTVWNSSTPTEYLTYLDNSVLSAVEQNKVVTLGCHDDSSIAYLSSRYLDIITTGIYYTDNDYLTLLHHNAEYHVHMLQNNIIVPNDNDIKLLNSLDTARLVDHYTIEFDKQNLIPQSTDPVCMFNISYTDLFDRKKVQNFFDAIGLPLTKDSQDFYDSWLSAYSER